MEYKLSDKHSVILTEVIGGGGFSTVYKGKSGDLTTAVKRIIYKTGGKEKPVLNKNKQDIAKKEIAVYRKLENLSYNRTIVKFFDYVDDNISFWIIFEFCDLGNLESYMVSKPPLFVQKLDIIKQCAAGLSFLHSECKPPIVHGDIKPSNILVKQEDECVVYKLSDFAGKEGSGSSVGGTRRFNPPEEFKSRRNFNRIPADIYSFGLLMQIVILYKPSRPIKIPTAVSPPDCDYIGSTLASGESVKLFDEDFGKYSALLRKIKDMINDMVLKSPDERKPISDVYITVDTAMHAQYNGKYNAAWKELNLSTLHDPVMKSLIGHLNYINILDSNEMDELNYLSSEHGHECHQKKLQDILMKKSYEQHLKVLKTLKDVEMGALAKDILSLGDKFEKVIQSQRSKYREALKKLDLRSLKDPKGFVSHLYYKKIVDRNEKDLLIAIYLEDGAQQHNKQLLDILMSKSDEQLLDVIKILKEDVKQEDLAQQIHILAASVKKGAEKVYRVMENMVYKVQKTLDKGGMGKRLLLVNGDIWCTTETGLYVYNIEVELVNTIKYRHVGKFVQATIPTTTSDIIIADKNKGVFLLNKEGETVKELCDGWFSALTEYQGKVYGLEWVHGHVVVFEYKMGTWSKCNVIELSEYRGDYWDRIGIHNNTMYISSLMSHCLTMYTMDGQLISRHGQYGKDLRGSTAGMLDTPLLCGVDTSGTALVADYYNHRLQTCTSTGQWKIITRVWRPWDVVVNGTDKSVWVLHRDEHKHKLLKLTC